MGRVEETPVHQSSDQTPSQAPPPQGYTNHHDNPLSSPQPPQEAYLGHNDQHMNHPQSTRSYVVPQSSEKLPPHEVHPHQNPPTYKMQQTPETYPPQQPQAVYPPQPGPAAFPPQQQPATYPPEQTPESYPSNQPPVGNASSYIPQSYNYTSYNAQPQVVNYGGTPNGIPIGVQSLAPTQGWTTGILDCLDDPENAIMTLCFPCVTFGQIAEIVDNGQTSCATNGLIYSLVAAFIGIPCIISCSYRTKLRSRYGLMETGPDWAIHFFCEYCALCQEYRELKARGMDPAIGWQGNLSKNQQMANYATMTPPMNQTMRG